MYSYVGWKNLHLRQGGAYLPKELGTSPHVGPGVQPQWGLGQNPHKLWKIYNNVI